MHILDFEIIIRVNSTVSSIRNQLINAIPCISQVSLLSIHAPLTHYKIMLTAHMLLYLRVTNLISIKMVPWNSRKMNVPNMAKPLIG